MYLRGHRGVGALVLLIVLALGAMALLPTLSRASTNQITGLVTDCANPALFLNGARVTLTDANGVQTIAPFVTGSDGIFGFSPAAGSFTLSATRTGYYASAVIGPLRFDGSTTVTQDFCLYAQNPSGLPQRLVAVTVQNTHAQPIAGASVSAYNITGDPSGAPPFQFITTVVTNATGIASLSVWQGTFQLRSTAAWYAPNNDTLPDTGTTFTVTMQQLNEVVGHARNSSGNFLSAGLVATLYNPGQPATSPWRMISANINGSLYDVHAPAGTYTLIVDANLYSAYETTVTLPGTSNPTLKDATLSLAPKERYDTTVVFGARDFGNFTVYRNVTLSADSTVPGLGPANIRDLRLQIDATLGNGDGVLSAGEATAFQNWLQAKGPFYVTTDTFLLTNNKAYNSTASGYSVGVSNLLGTGPVTITTSDVYHLKPGTSPIPFGGANYFVNTTLLPDVNTTAYQNYTYTVELPSGYEMVTDTVFGTVSVSNYTHVELDPGIQSGTNPVTPQVKMTIQPAHNGTARAAISDPVGKFYVFNSTYQKYQAYVANNTSITFTAAASTNPPSNDPTRANYTWRFEANVNPALVGTGISPKFTYKTPGQYTVNLTMVGSGGNVSYRNITVWVDGSPPVGNFRTNLTGSGSAVGRTLQINQGTIVRFDGSLSTDLAYTGKNGIIPNSGWAWDFNGDRITDATGRIQNQTFTKPGQFTVNLTVTDSVGWKASNVSMTLIVNDTEGPSPHFVILDPSNEWAVVSQSNLFENHTYSFNASSTTDNYDKVSNLTFEWTVPGPLIGMNGTKRTLPGVNITFGWSQWNASYSLNLSVKDTGFGSHKPNYGNLTTNLTIQIDSKLHADLMLNTGSLKIGNTNPEQGQTITLSVNVTNKLTPTHATAQRVTATVTEIDPNGASTVLSRDASWTNKTGAPLSNHSIAPGVTVTLTFSVTVLAQGNVTIKVHVEDATEPSPWITAENSAQQSIFVRQPGWVPIAIAGSVIGVFAVFIFAMYYRRKVKAGEWQPRFRRREKKGEGGEKRPKKEKEVKEEKKRL